MRGGHGRAHPELARNIVGRREYTPTFGTAPHRHGDTAQRWVVTHLYGGVKAISVDVNDLALHGSSTQSDVKAAMEDLPLKPRIERWLGDLTERVARQGIGENPLSRDLVATHALT